MTADTNQAKQSQTKNWQTKYLGVTAKANRRIYSNNTLGDFHDVYLKAEVDTVLAEKDAEIRKLKRALWLARAERAKEMCRRLLIQGFDPKWEEVERKCLKKAKEYL